ncbi:MAG: ferritin family protein [Candidatus Brocadiia bacterium]
MSIFDAREMLRIAVMDEETGVAFYHSLASATRRPDVQSECIAIGKQEEMHAQRFRRMLDDLGAYTPQEEYAGQYQAFLNALVESRVFPSPAEAGRRAAAARSDVEAIDLAIRLEKDTFIFFLQIKPTLPPVHTAVVEAVINEERQHLTDLARLRRTVGAG